MISDWGGKILPMARCRKSLRGAYVRRSTHCAREAGGSNGAPKTQVVLAILADRTSMMLMTCQVTPSGVLGPPEECVDVTRPLDSQECEIGPRTHLSSLPPLYCACLPADPLGSFRQ